jgi:ABC-type sugar transport system substrate-binding protein
MKNRIAGLFAIGFLIVFMMTPSFVSAKGGSQDSGKVYVGVVNISMESEYWASLANGAKIFVDSLPAGSAEFVLMPGDSADKQVANVESFITKYGKNGCIFLDPNNASITPIVVQKCEEAGVKLVIYATLGDNLYPTDYENFVVFMTQDDENSAYLASKDLFDSMGGRGNVCELYGIPGNDAALKRNAGLKRALAEYPGITLLDTQIANYNTNEALKITDTWFAKFGDTIDGIFCSSDGMALGAAEAAKKAGLAGKVKIVGFDGQAGALDAIKEGSMYSTIFNNGYLVGGFAAAYGYAARTGNINVKTMEQAKRMFYTKIILVKQNNVDDMINNYVKSLPKFDFTNLESCIDGIMPNKGLL